MNKEYVYSDLFKLLPQSSKVSKIELVPDGKTPAYSSDTRNNGCVGFVNKEPLFNITEKAPVYLVFGDHTRTMNIVHKDFCVMDNVKVLAPLVSMSDEVLLYITTCWKKAIPNLGYARHWSVAKTARFELPVIESPDPDHEYTPADIDWQYMQERVRELEEERVRELEEERVRELEAYLKAASLSDCELDDGDRQTLREFSEREFKDYRITDYFVVRNTHSILKEWVRFGGSRPYVTAGSSDNSVAGYIDYDESQLEEGNSIMVGGKTTVVTYQPCDYFSNDSHNLAVFPKNSAGRTELAQLFIASALQKSLGAKYSWGDSVSYRKIRKDVVSLPVGSDGEPDFAYMERYVRAIEKLAIADVVKYKDKMIKTTRQIVGA